MAIASVLLMDSSMSAILFNFNEFSLLPVALQIISLAWQFMIFVLNGNGAVQQYLYSDIFLYFAYLGL